MPEGALLRRHLTDEMSTLSVKTRSKAPGVGCQWQHSSGPSTFDFVSYVMNYVFYKR